MSTVALTMVLTLTAGSPAQAPMPPQAPPARVEEVKPKVVKESQCKCPGKGNDACNCPGKDCADCGCKCGKQRKWTPCNRPCCCGCQDEDGAYCDCGEKAVGSAPILYGTYTPYQPAFAATTMGDRRPRPATQPQPRPVPPRPAQPHCPPGGT